MNSGPIEGQHDGEGEEADEGIYSRFEQTSLTGIS